MVDGPEIPEHGRVPRVEGASPYDVGASGTFRACTQQYCLPVHARFIRALCHKCPLVFGGTCIGAGPWEHVQGPAPMSFSMTALVL